MIEWLVPLDGYNRKTAVETPKPQKPAIKQAGEQKYLGTIVHFTLARDLVSFQFQDVIRMPFFTYPSFYYQESIELPVAIRFDSTCGLMNVAVASWP